MIFRRSLPTWLKLSSEDVKEQIYKLAKKGLTPSQIGVILRDSHGVAQVCSYVHESEFDPSDAYFGLKKTHPFSSGEICDGNQSSPYPEGKGFGLGNPRRSLSHD